VVNYGVRVNSLLDSHDVTFFENIFPMKDSHTMSRLPLNETTNAPPESTKLSKHDEHTLELHHEKIHSEAPRTSKGQRIVRPRLAQLIFSFFTNLSRSSAK
jgi:hypothetical protein